MIYDNIVSLESYRSMSLTLTTRPKVPSPSVAMILSEMCQRSRIVVGLMADI